MRARRATVALLVLGAACAQRRAEETPLLVRVEQAQSVPTFSHAQLKVFRDEGGRAGAFLRGSGCLAVASIPVLPSGRRRLEVTVPAGGPYYLQFSGHTEPGCNPSSAVAAALAPGITAVSGRSSVVPIFAAPLDVFVPVAPPAVSGAEVVRRAFHAAAVADDGSLIVSGGAQEVLVLGSAACARGLSRCFRLGRATSGIHRFDPGSGAMVLIGALQDRRFLHSATPLSGGRVAFAGGAQAATLGGAAAPQDAPLMRADPLCTNPNDAEGAGCILRTVEVHPAAGGAPAVASLQVGRAAHAALRIGPASVLLAGGRESALQLGCTSDLQCAAGAVCDGGGRCLRNGRDCLQVGNVAEVCLPGYTCEPTGPDAGKCLKRGCSSAADCGGCLAASGCGGPESTCDESTRTCVRRGCSVDSECLGSNRRCLQGTCVQVGCDSLSGCPAGRTCDVRTGKCRPVGSSIDCTQPGACDCVNDSGCAPGFTCQTDGDLAGRCRNTRTGCPATACRRAPSEPLFDPVTGDLRRNVNCEGGQCVLRGCLGDVDCAPGFLCDAGKCVNGRRVTAATRAVEICDLTRTVLPAGACVPADPMAVAREGLSAACVARGGRGDCEMALLWGGNADPAHVAELRAPNGAPAGEVALPGCAAPGACTPAFSALVEGPNGILALGGAALESGPSYRFLSVAYLVPSASPTSAQLLSARLSAPRAFAAALPVPEGIAVLGGAAADLTAISAGGLLSGDGGAYSEPESLRLGAARFGHTATVLRDGRIVVVGGVDPAGPTVLSSVEVLTPRASLR
jgi:hypothetical protein